MSTILTSESLAVNQNEESHSPCVASKALVREQVSQQKPGQ